MFTQFKSFVNRKNWKPGVLVGALAIMLAALLWSIDGLFIRPMFYQLPAELVVFLEHILGFILLSPFIFRYWPNIKLLSRKSWMAIAWISLFGGLIGTVFITKAFFAAFDGEVSFAVVVILQKLQPIFALLLARLILRERLSKNFYIWAALAILASYFLAFSQDSFNINNLYFRQSGALFAFIAAFAFGSSTVFGKRISNHLDYKAVAALRFGVTTILSLILIIINGGMADFGLISFEQWKLLILIVLTSGAGAMFIYYFGLRRVPASSATILELFWPFSALILDYIFNRNYLDVVQWGALAVLLLAFYKISRAGHISKVKFSGRIVKGQGRGKRLGFPTANLDKIDIDIPHGVYAVRVILNDKKYLGLMHFGFKDVFREDVSLEVFIQDFSGDIYGETLQVEVLDKIRNIKRFATPDHLIEAVKSDQRHLRHFSR
ncbi:MAG: EamA family transporter [Proteiniphilum sp.]|nr:EamA family transporter [Proteiniphilum sp.]